MIRRIRGELAGTSLESVFIDVHGLTYEVFVPPCVMDRFASIATGADVQLETFHYLTTDPTKSVPVLLGFENETQREFFFLLTDVPRMGPKAALRCFTLPVSTFARVIEMEDTRALKSLPGVGPQKAKDIIATLGGKLSAFLGDEIDLPAGEKPPRSLDAIELDAVEILAQLGTNRADAMHAVRQARENDETLQTADDIVRFVFRSRK